jgi:hypothetical protein
MIKDCDRKGESHFEMKQENNPVSPGKVTVVFEFATKLGCVSGAGLRRPTSRLTFV